MDQRKEADIVAFAIDVMTCLDPLVSASSEEESVKRSRQRDLLANVHDITMVLNVYTSASIK
jgi:hypothetical protein